MLYQVAKILLSLLTGKSVKNCPEINKNMIMPAVEKSYLPFIISELLLEAEDGYYEILLKVGIELTLLSPKICKYHQFRYVTIMKFCTYRIIN